MKYLAPAFRSFKAPFSGLAISGLSNFWLSNFRLNDGWLINGYLYRFRPCCCC